MPALTGFLLCIVMCFSTLLSKKCHPLEFGLKTHYGTVSATLDTVSDHSRSPNENTVYVTVTNEIVDRIRDTLATQKLCLQQIVIVYCNISGPTLSVCLYVCMYCFVPFCTDLGISFACQLCHYKWCLSLTVCKNILECTMETISVDVWCKNDFLQERRVVREPVPIAYLR